MLFQDTGKLRAELEGLRVQKSSLIETLARCQSVSHALADENRDLVRQLELHKAVLAQLSIPVKLPVRKPNG